MAKGDIRLSPKYGVNPTIPICFWCGEKKNEIALMGLIGDRRKGEDIEAPRNMILDYEPCDDCKEKMSLGVVCVEVSSEPRWKSQPSLSDDHYPTGCWSVIKTSAAEKIFNLDLDFHDGQRIMLDEEAYDALFRDPSAKTTTTIMDKTK